MGATKPDLLRSEGEAYREKLVAQTRRLRMENHVRFVDKFIGRVELTRWLEAADVFVTPYPDLDQIVSGTMSYAMGAGRAIVSTPFAYAVDLLADGRGRLVPPESPEELAIALNELLGDRDLRLGMGRRAYEHSRRMVWSAVGAEYARVLSRSVASAHLAARPAEMATVSA